MFIYGQIVLGPIALSDTEQRHSNDTHSITSQWLTSSLPAWRIMDVGSGGAGGAVVHFCWLVVRIVTGMQSASITVGLLYLSP